ncbi:MAG TPA: aminodeoxychorismate/anthranilate synthase component II [Actinomycetota bacterium]|nr:aminodeoxychorismate/anthranilate synthase component II [Actinomycetota bacterium]
MKILLVDNFDSFVYNLAQAFGALGATPVVMRSDSSIDDLRAVEPDGVVISPGPGAPEDAGVSLDAIETFAPRVPVLGVCLGHQCIGVVYGGSVERAGVGPVHGKTSVIEHDGRGLFSGVVSPMTATRYHSLAINQEGFPEPLEVTARSSDGIVMGVRHKDLPVEGVQFHPESVLTEDGPRLMQNFLNSVA